MADITVFITSTTGSFVGSAVQTNTSTFGKFMFAGKFSGEVVRVTGRHRNACVKTQKKVNMSSAVVIRLHAKNGYELRICGEKVLPYLDSLGCNFQVKNIGYSKHFTKKLRLRTRALRAPAL